MKKNIFTRVIVTVMAAALILATAACGKKEAKEEEPKYFIDVQQDGSVLVNFDKTAKGTGGGTGIAIEEGEYLVIESALTKGKVHVVVKRGGDDINEVPAEDSDTPATMDGEVEGSGETEYMMIEPGNYFFSVMVEKTANGTITASKRALPADDADAGDTAAAQ